MKLNGQPIDIMQPECLKMKALEPALLLGAERFAHLDIRITVKGGGRVAQIYGTTCCSFSFQLFVRLFQELLLLSTRSVGLKNVDKG